MKAVMVQTEAEWLSCAVPRHMLRFLHHRASDRKLRLWACASVIRQFGHDRRLDAAVALAERWADGQRPADPGRFHDYYVCSESAWDAAYEGAVRGLEKWSTSEKKRQATRFQVETLRDVFGNPFRTVNADPSWLTSNVVQLARGAYDEKAFDRMPILADALQDAGCDNDEVLLHCRQANWEHVRGCWVIDLLLGRPWREVSSTTG